MSALYPHLLPEDIPVWERFLLKFGHDYIRFDYDVRTQPQYDPGPGWPDNYRKDAMMLSARRIDVVAFTNYQIDIIEVTRSAGLTAIGQLTTYPVLYQMTYKPLVNVRALLVAESLQTGIEEVLYAQHIAYEIV